MKEIEKQRVSRRGFLKVVGAGAAGLALAGSGAALLLGKTQGADRLPPGSRRLRRWAMVIDLRRCDGCQAAGQSPQCTQACIQGHLAPEPMEWVQVFEYELPGGGTQFVPVPCQQCQNPPCVNVCPVGATFSTPEGPVLIDQNRCIGCRMCMAACPYDRRFFTWATPPIPPEALFVEYHPERQAPLRRGTTNKCVFCPDLARAGKLPYCAQGCPTNALYYGDLEEDIATNGVEVVKLSHFLSENSAYQLKADLGTKPRVYYIAGYGQAVGRNPYRRGRQPTTWPWMDKLAGSRTWQRSGR